MIAGNSIDASSISNSKLGAETFSCTLIGLLPPINKTSLGFHFLEGRQGTSVSLQAKLSRPLEPGKQRMTTTSRKE